MKYDAVNFHYKNIYKKLEVNSKIELILRYGQKLWKPLLNCLCFSAIAAAKAVFLFF